jgi:folate-binding protein YgfZ
MKKAPWTEFLASTGALDDDDAVSSRATCDAIAARDATIRAPLTHLSVAGFSGDDAQTYLHNLLTSDVKALGTGAFQHSAACTPKGRIFANLILYRNKDVYRALLSADLVETTLKRLRMYVLRSKVTLSDESDSVALIGVSGPDASEVLRTAALPLSENGIAEFDGGMLIRLEEKRYIVAAAQDEAIELWKKLDGKAVPTGVGAWQWLDIRAGIPWIGKATEEKFVPQMLGLEKIDGVSFTKGCYPGQEVVARSQYLGQLKRHLYRLHSETPLHVGEAIFSAPETVCGNIVNAAPAPEGGYDALAVLKDETATAEIRTATASRLGSIEAVR